MALHDRIFSSSGGTTTGTTGPAPTGGSDQYVSFFEKVGPSSYATGGFTIDLRSTYFHLNDVKLMLKKGARGNVPAHHIVYHLNDPSDGMVTVIIQRHRYVRTSAVGAVIGQPSGVTVQSSSGATTSTESSHSHSINHTHATVTATQTNSGAGVNSSLLVLNTNVSAHTHAWTIPAFTGTSGAGTAHSHTDDNIYAHVHTLSPSDASGNVSELAAGTNLSTTIWYGVVSGTRQP